MMLARFAEKIEKEPGGCWLWIAAKLPNGYGRFNWNGRAGYAHRYAYEAANGPIPAGMHICHSCDVPACVNPEHLFAATQKENMRDMVRKGRGHWQTDPERAAAMGRGIKNRHSTAKLSTDDVAVVRYLIARGSLFPDIATVFGVSTAAISDIANGRSWNDN